MVGGRHRGLSNVIFLTATLTSMLVIIHMYPARIEPIEAGTSRRLPDFIIIGVKKGGTRALLDMASLHPDVAHCIVELNFFSDDVSFGLGMDWYKSMMPLSREGQLTVEKSTLYFSRPKTPKRIFTMNPGVKLILVVREPVDRAVSDFAQSVAFGAHVNETFEKHAFKDGKFSNVNTKWEPIAMSHYARYMDHWLEFFPLQQILILEATDLIRDPLSQMKRLERFLGLKPFYTSDNFQFSAQKGFVCLRKGPEEEARCLPESKGRKHPDVHPKAVSRLRKYFSKYNEMFFAQVKQNFSWPKE